MGLRINTNIAGIQALNNLQRNDRLQRLSLERLSTGLRINRGSDDPSGLVISEQLRVQLAGLNKAVENSQNASNLISVADAALQEVSNLLTEIQDSVVFAQNTGGASPEQITAEQDTVDQAIAAIDRIASTTRFADRPLLNGNAGFQLNSTIPDIIDDVHFRSAEFAGTSTDRNIPITVTANPQRATLLLTNAMVSVTSTLRITGPRGTDDVIVSAGATGTDFASAINTVAGFTGVYASEVGDGNDILLRSEEFGTEQNVRMEVVSGLITVSSIAQMTSTASTGEYTAFAGVTILDGGDIFADTGRNGIVTIDGASYTGVGRTFSIVAKSVSFRFSLDADVLSTENTSAVPTIGGTAGAGPHTLTVSNTGLQFQLNELPLPTDRLAVGIEGMATANLGRATMDDIIAGNTTIETTDDPQMGGFLNSIKTGGANDLFTNPNNASVIVGAAVKQVAQVRGFIGAVQGFSIEPNINALGVSIENLSASLSDLRDLDFAQETANFTRSQILFQSGIAVLASANLIPQSVLTLLR